MRIFDWIFLTRPIVLIPAWAFLIAGYLRGTEVSGSPVELAGPFGIAFVLLTLLLAGIYIVNQIFDQETDQVNGKLFLLASGHLPVRGAWIEAALLTSAALIPAIVLHRTHLPYLLASLVLGILYSADPIRLKGKPFFDLLANAAGYGAIAFLYGYSLTAPVGGGVWLSTIPYMLLVAAVFLHTAVVDRPGDEKAGLTTSASILGDRGTSIAAMIALVAAFGTGLWLGEPYPPVAALGGLFFFTWGLIFPGIKGSTLSYQWASLIFILLVVIRFPLFGALLVLLVAATRIYYRLRFQMVYPKLDF